MSQADSLNQPRVRHRLPGDERKNQIVEATLKLVARCGVQGTTLHRIAKEVGVTHPALYAHFENRREILIAALDVLFDRILEGHKVFTQENALERLRALTLHHTKLVSSASDSFVAPLFEFLAASPEEGLREELAAREQVLNQDLADIIREGQQQGTIRADVDPEVTAWLITSRHWGEDVAVLMGVMNGGYLAGSTQLLDLIIASIQMPDPSGSDG